MESGSGGAEARHCCRGRCSTAFQSWDRRIQRKALEARRGGTAAEAVLLPPRRVPEGHRPDCGPIPDDERRRCSPRSPSAVTVHCSPLSDREVQDRGMSVPPAARGPAIRADPAGPARAGADRADRFPASWRPQAVRVLEIPVARGGHFPAIPARRVGRFRAILAAPARFADPPDHQGRVQAGPRLQAERRLAVPVARTAPGPLENRMDRCRAARAWAVVAGWRATGCLQGSERLCRPLESHVAGQCPASPTEN